MLWAEEVLLKLDGTPMDVEVQNISTVFDDAPAIQVTMRGYEGSIPSTRSRLSGRGLGSEWGRGLDISARTFFLRQLSGLVWAPKGRFPRTHRAGSPCRGVAQLARAPVSKTGG